MSKYDQLKAVKKTNANRFSARWGQAKQRLAFADMRIGSAKIGRFAKWHNSLVAIDIRSGALCAVIQ
jgi:hypothetical protein